MPNIVILYDIDKPRKMGSLKEPSERVQVDMTEPNIMYLGVKGFLKQSNHIRGRKRSPIQGKVGNSTFVYDAIVQQMRSTRNTKMSQLNSLKMRIPKE